MRARGSLGIRMYKITDLQVPGSSDDGSIETP